MPEPSQPATLPLPLAGDFPPATLPQWRALIDKVLKGADFDRRLVGRTADDIRIEPLYVSRPASGSDGAVGRGGAGWDIRQLHAATDPAAANAAILEDLAGGATSLLLQVEASGWRGLPSTVEAMARTLDGVLLDVCPVALKAGEVAPAAADSLIAAWTAKGIEPTRRLGAFNFAPIATLAEAGGLDEPLPRALETAARLLQRTLPWPGVTALAADGPVWHAAGASEAQELAAVLAETVAYLRAAEAVGIEPALALPKIAITLAVDADQMMGLAKLRAARRLIARVAGACNAAGAAGMVQVAAETSRTMMSKRDPWVNMLRTTMACATAAWGGADSICVLPYSFALGQPDAFARRMARNTSIVLMEESGLGRVADPAAGSFAIETLTAELASVAWAEFQAIERQGGLGKVLESGQWQASLARTAAAKGLAVATGKAPLTGTSAFPKLGDDGVSASPWPAPAGAARKAAGARVAPLTMYRPAAPFEALRDRADAFQKQTGAPPLVFLVCLGPLAEHAARATWIANVLAAGGIASVQSAPIEQTADAGRAFADSGASVACLCGTDERYGALGEAAAQLLKTVGAKAVYLAGRPKAQEAALRTAGVDGFLYQGMNMLDALDAVQTALGVAGARA